MVELTLFLSFYYEVGMDQAYSVHGSSSSRISSYVHVFAFHSSEVMIDNGKCDII